MNLQFPFIPFCSLIDKFDFVENLVVWFSLVQYLRFVVFTVEFAMHFYDWLSSYYAAVFTSLHGKVVMD